MLFKITSRDFNLTSVTGSTYKANYLAFSKTPFWVRSKNWDNKLYNANAVMQKYFPNPSNNYMLDFAFHICVAFAETKSDSFVLQPLSNMLSSIYNYTAISAKVNNARSLKYVLSADSDWRKNNLITYHGSKDVTNPFGLSVSEYLSPSTLDKSKIPDGYFSLTWPNQYQTKQEEGARRRDVYLDLSDFGQASNKLSDTNPGHTIWEAIDGPFTANASVDFTSNAGLAGAEAEIHFPQGVVGSGAFADDNGIACTWSPFSPIIFPTNNQNVGVVVIVGVTLV